MVGYKELLDIVIKSEQEYDNHIEKFKEWRQKEDWEWLYDNLKEFENLDGWYYSKGEDHYIVFEKFGRENIDDFIIKT